MPLSVLRYSADVYTSECNPLKKRNKNISLISIWVRAQPNALGVG